ncbi:MAG: hypothetical protein ACNYPH_01340, partial [Gammaproteobacteria bacterium WSBS_2016_MAG_OTU1]
MMIKSVKILLLYSLLICFAHIGGGIAQTAEVNNSTISEYGDKKAKTHAVARENYGAKVQFAAFSPNADTLSENTNILQVKTKNSETDLILLAQVGSSEIAINGVFEHAQTLTTDISQLADTNPNNYTYQWWRSIDNGATFAEISGATGQEYVVDSFGDFRITTEGVLAQVYMSAVHKSTSVNYNSPNLIYQPVTPQVELEYFYDNLYIEYLPDHPASTISVNIVSSNIATENANYSFVVINNLTPHTVRKSDPTNPVFALDQSTFGISISVLIEGIPVNQRRHLRFRVDVDNLVDYLSGNSGITISGHRQNLQRSGIGRIEIVGDENGVREGSVLQPYLEDINGVNRGQTLQYRIVLRKDIRGVGATRSLGDIAVVVTAYNPQLPRYTLTAEDVRFIESPGGGVGINLIKNYRDGLGYRDNIFFSSPLRELRVLDFDIDGDFEEGKTLVANASQLPDTDANNYTYQWWRSIDNGATFAEISGATGQEYVVDSFGDFRITTVGVLAQVYMSAVHKSTSVNYNSPNLIYQEVTPQVELEYFYDNLYIEYLPDHPASTISVNIVSSNIVTENPAYLFVVVNDGEFHTSTKRDPTNPVFALDLATFSSARLQRVIDRIPVDERGEIGRLNFRVDVDGLVDYLSGKKDIRIFGHEEPLQRAGIGRIEVVGGGNIVEVGSVLQPYIEDVNGVDRNQTLDYSFVLTKDASNISRGIKSLGQVRVPATRYNQPLPRYTLTIEDIRFIESPGGGVFLTALTEYRDGLGTFSTFSVAAGALTVRVFNFDIDGVFNEGERLRANIETSELSDTNPDNYTYQWWRSIDNGESFTEINNATNQEYVVDLARDFIITSVTAQILVSIIHISTSIGQVSHPVTLIDSPGTERLEVVGGETILTVGSVLQPHLDDANGFDRGQTLSYLIGFVGTSPNGGQVLIIRHFTVTTTIYNQPLPSYTLNVVDIEFVASRVPGINIDADIIVPRFEWRDALGNINNEGRTSPNINDIVALTIGVSLDLNIRGVFEEGKTLTVDVSQ